MPSRLKMLLTSSIATFVLSAAFAASATADTTPQTPPFSQNWTDPALITANDDWSGVPGIIGYLGDDSATTAVIDPRTITADRSQTVDVIANQTNPATLSNGGVAEFQITNPTVALQGSGTADAPHLVLALSTTGQTNVTIGVNVRDIDGSTDNAAQQFALQYRVGSTANYTNLAYIADATTGPSLATQVTPISATLPDATDNQPLVQVRFLTTNAAGNDEWIGIDDITAASVAPTAVGWRGGTAKATRSGVTVSWKTGFEADNLGFDVLRVRKGSATRVKITRKLIAGSALSGTNGNSGSYAFRDAAGKRGDKYFVVSRATDGTKKVHGPLVARTSTRKASR